MLVPETQSRNEAAIAFYRKNGFSLIGFDLYAYSNSDPERHEVRFEMGKKLPPEKAETGIGISLGTLAGLILGMCIHRDQKDPAE